MSFYNAKSGEICKQEEKEGEELLAFFFFFFEDLSRNVPRALLGVKRRKGILKRIIVDYLFTSRY